MKTTFVYPWINPGGYAEQELRMSLRSLEENVVGDYQVVVVGDCPPRLADLLYIKHEQNLIGKDPKAVDAVLKLQAIIDCPHVPDQFVYMADDIALLQPFSPAHLERVALYEAIDGRIPLHKINDGIIQRTINALRAAGARRTWNYETHMPRLFSKRRLQELFAKYDPLKNRLMVPTLYFNHFFPGQEPLLLHRMDNQLARFTGRTSEYTIGPGTSKGYYLQRMVGKRYANWNDDAINQHFVDALLHLLPRKSTHETSRKAYLPE